MTDYHYKLCKFLSYGPARTLGHAIHVTIQSLQEVRETAIKIGSLNTWDSSKNKFISELNDVNMEDIDWDIVQKETLIISILRALSFVGISIEDLQKIDNEHRVNEVMEK